MSDDKHRPHNKGAEASTLIWLDQSDVGGGRNNGKPASPFILAAMPLVHHAGNYFQSAYKWLCQDPEVAERASKRVRSGLKNNGDTYTVLKAFYTTWESKWRKFKPHNPSFGQILHQGADAVPPTNNPSMFATKAFWKWYIVTSIPHSPHDHLWFMEMFRVWVNMTSEGTYCLQNCTRNMVNQNVYGLLEVLRYRATRNYRKGQLQLNHKSPNNTFFTIWNPFKARLEKRALSDEETDLLPQLVGRQPSLRQQEEQKLSQNIRPRPSTSLEKDIIHQSSDQMMETEKIKIEAKRTQRAREAMDLCSQSPTQGGGKIDTALLLKKNITVQEHSYKSLMHLVHSHRAMVVEPSQEVNGQLQNYLNMMKPTTTKVTEDKSKAAAAVVAKNLLAQTVYPSGGEDTKTEIGTRSKPSSPLSAISSPPNQKESQSKQRSASVSVRPRRVQRKLETLVTADGFWVEMDGILCSMDNNNGNDDDDCPLSLSSGSCSRGSLSSSMDSSTYLSLFGGEKDGAGEGEVSPPTRRMLPSPPINVCMASPPIPKRKVMRTVTRVVSVENQDCPVSPLLHFVSSSDHIISPRRKKCPPVSPRQPLLETTPTAADSPNPLNEFDHFLNTSSLTATCYCHNVSCQSVVVPSIC